jgi:hypothetical protein
LTMKDSEVTTCIFCQLIPALSGKYHSYSTLQISLGFSCTSVSPIKFRSNSKKKVPYVIEKDHQNGEKGKKISILSRRVMRTALPDIFHRMREIRGGPKKTISHLIPSKYSLLFPSINQPPAQATSSAAYAARTHAYPPPKTRH